MNRIRSSFGIALAVWVSSTAATAGMTLTVDPDTGSLSTDGTTWVSSLSWNGSTIKAGGIGADGAREDRVFGDFNVGAADTVTARLGTSLGVRFIVGNNATLALVMSGACGALFGLRKRGQRQTRNGRN